MAGIAFQVTGIFHACKPTLAFTLSEIVSGGASGADSCGERWASVHELPVKTFLPDWNQHGKSAGIVRNVEMALYADALVAFWDGQSRGTKHMIDYANKQGLKVKVFAV